MTDKPTIRGALMSAQRFAQAVGSTLAQGAPAELLKEIAVEARRVEIECADVLDPNYEQREQERSAAPSGTATPTPYRLLKRRESDDEMDIEEPYMDSDWYIAGPSRRKAPENADALEVQAAMNPMPVAWINQIVADEGHDPEAVGAFMVKACNGYDDLLATLQAIADGDPNAAPLAREAIEKAEQPMA